MGNVALMDQIILKNLIDEYVKSSRTNTGLEFQNIQCILPKRVVTPLYAGYRPELDFSKELNPK